MLSGGVDIVYGTETLSNSVCLIFLCTSHRIIDFETSPLSYCPVRQTTCCNA